MVTVGAYTIPGWWLLIIVVGTHLSAYWAGRNVERNVWLARDADLVRRLQGLSDQLAASAANVND